MYFLHSAEHRGEMFTFLLYMQVMISNLSEGTECIEILCAFSQIFQANCGIVS